MLEELVRATQGGISSVGHRKGCPRTSGRVKAKPLRGRLRRALPQLAHAENATLARALLADTAAEQADRRGQLTIHADRGSPMVAKPVASLLAS